MLKNVKKYNNGIVIYVVYELEITSWKKISTELLILVFYFEKKFDRILIYVNKVFIFAR